MYAVVDIETTGGYASANGITEVAIHIFDGNRIVESFQSLVNPRQVIPRYIEAMTGISNAMVEDAPAFEMIADRVYALLHDKIFIAHNVNFDYSFLKAHLAASNLQLNTKKLCTVRLSRKLLPGYSSYSLGKLCNSLDIMLTDRHRAGGDAAATVQLFKLLLEKDADNFIGKSLQRTSKEQTLPPNVPREHFEQLPYTPGIYYFHNEKGKIIYVGKAKNIRYRVNSHFSNNSSGRQKQNFMRHVHAISCKPCATELMANILESTEIKKLWPAFNNSQKRWEDIYGIFTYEDQNGYKRLVIEKNKRLLKPIHSFHYLVDGHSLMRKLIREYRLCPKLCFLQSTSIACEGRKEQFCDGACDMLEASDVYNARVDKAIMSLSSEPSYAILENGLEAEQQSCVLVWEGKFYGMGYIPTDTQLNDIEDLKNFLTPYKENLFIRNLVHGYAARFPEKVMIFQ